MPVTLDLYPGVLMIVLFFCLYIMGIECFDIDSLNFYGLHFRYFDWILMWKSTLGKPCIRIHILEEDYILSWQAMTNSRRCLLG